MRIVASSDTNLEVRAPLKPDALRAALTLPLLCSGNLLLKTVRAESPSSKPGKIIGYDLHSSAEGLPYEPEDLARVLHRALEGVTPPGNKPDVDGSTGRGFFLKYDPHGPIGDRHLRISIRLCWVFWHK